MTAHDDAEQSKLYLSVFRMPLVQTMKSRKSSVTNAFVNAIVPLKIPTWTEIREALRILNIDPHDMQCTYCGGKYTEWDHLRPLVIGRRPTGRISEIGNLVPACGKCNQSKGNKDWREWMLSNKPRSPTGRRLPDVPERISRLEAFVQWREPTFLDIERIIGKEAWDGYWLLLTGVDEQMASCQEIAQVLRRQIDEHFRGLG